MTHLLLILPDQTYCYHKIQLPAGQVLLDFQKEGGLPDYIKSEITACNHNGLYSTFCWRDWIFALPEDDVRTASFQASAENRLSRRQLDVLHCLSQGKTGKQIAGRLNISQRSVSLHISALKRNLQANTTAECVQKAVRLGILKSGG